MAHKRCVCGRSSRFPLCDGSHRDADWTCARPEASARWLVVGSQSLHSLVERLAHRLGGQAGWNDEVQRATDLVVLFDGTDAAVLKTQLESVQATRVRILCIGIAPHAASWAFGSAEVVRVPEGSTGLFLHVEKALLDGASPATDAPPDPRVFLSHAVADEPTLVEVVASLREGFGVPVFSCADSIETGARWHPEIMDHIQRCDCLILVCSEASSGSVFCAYEVGIAMALGKRVHLVGLDGTTPFLPVSHLQCESVPRLMARKPWLTRAEAILEAVLVGVA